MFLGANGKPFSPIRQAFPYRNGTKPAFFHGRSAPSIDVDQLLRSEIASTAQFAEADSSSVLNESQVVQINQVLWTSRRCLVLPKAV